jgi:hypothetical protein
MSIKTKHEMKAVILAQKLESYHAADKECNIKTQTSYKTYIHNIKTRFYDVIYFNKSNRILEILNTALTSYT